MPAVRRRYEGLNDRLHAFGLCDITIGQFAAHRGGQMIGPWRTGDKSSQHFGQLLRPLPERKDRRDGEFLAVGHLDVRAANIESEPIHKCVRSPVRPGYAQRIVPSESNSS